MKKEDDFTTNQPETLDQESGWGIENSKVTMQRKCELIQYQQYR